MFKKVSWKVGVYSRLSGYLIGHRRDSAARRVVSDTDTPKSSLKDDAKGSVSIYLFVSIDRLGISE